jgi:hypothetical protein
MEAMNLCSASAANASFFKRPPTQDLSFEEVSRLRKFLKEAGPGSQAEEPAQPSRMMVVIGQPCLPGFGGSRPAGEHKVQPYDPYNFHHHLIHRKEAHYRGERIPEEDSFYERSRKISLRRMRSSSSVMPLEKAAPPILIFGARGAPVSGGGSKYRPSGAAHRSANRSIPDHFPQTIALEDSCTENTPPKPYQILRRGFRTPPAPETQSCVGCYRRPAQHRAGQWVET